MESAIFLVLAIPLWWCLGRLHNIENLVRSPRDAPSRYITCLNHPGNPELYAKSVIASGGPFPLPPGGTVTLRFPQLDTIPERAEILSHWCGEPQPHCTRYRWTEGRPAELLVSLDASSTSILEGVTLVDLSSSRQDKGTLK